mgnify:CR=1 FL=1
MKKQLDKYDVSRSSFYHGFVEKEKLQPMYEEVRDKIMVMLDVIIEIEAVDFIRSKKPEERKRNNLELMLLLEKIQPLS